MMEGEGLIRNRADSKDFGFTKTLFSYTLEDIFDVDFYKNEVERIPESFESVKHYFESFKFPLLEETRAALQSSMEIMSTSPFAEVTAFDDKSKNGKATYWVTVDYWRNRFTNSGKEPYKTLPGDILIFADAKPESVFDLQQAGRIWTLAAVTKISYDENEDAGLVTNFKVRASKYIEVSDENQNGMHKSLYAIFLTNITTNIRIWKALHMFRNLTIIKEILYTEYLPGENCSLCSEHENDVEEKLDSLSANLNESQIQAVLACLHKVQCNHKSPLELIWGPPGTGKTKTVSVLLFTLLRMNIRTLTCAPTNVAITEVASRVLQLVKNSYEMGSRTNCGFFSLGDILLFGNKDRLKVGLDIEEIYLDYRVKRLAECFGPLTGWWHCFTTMIDFLEDCVSHYHIYLENELIREKELREENGRKTIETPSKIDDCDVKRKSFLEFSKDRFICTLLPLERCVFTMCTHIPSHYILSDTLENLISLRSLLDSFKTLLFSEDVISEELELAFSYSEATDDSCQSVMGRLSLLYTRRSECLSVLKTLHSSLRELNLPSAVSRRGIEQFCFQNANLIFCTANSSYKLHSMKIETLKLLVIDEAAQLKECESVIPLQLPGLKHAFLIGDECQLPAMVQSTISDKAGFRRSLFERLSLLGHSKNLLNIQYRMHPSISFFPNASFYSRQIIDAPFLRSKSYNRSYLPGSMFGPYSFINIIGGREEKDDFGHSRRNMVEVAVVVKIVRNLYKASSSSNQKLSVGVISPYTAQVVSIQERIGRKYDNIDGFTVKVKSVDGFQGGEEDIIIISTVRSNCGLIEFISSPQRTNVALTRARHCLWILGHERILMNSESVWSDLIRDAKKRQCFFNADDEKGLAKAIVEIKNELDQLNDLLNADSVLFRSARWKVIFSDNFMKAFKKLTSERLKKLVINVLLRLSTGWRPKRRNIDLLCESSSHILKQFKVEGLYIICTVDIVKKEYKYVQVLKVWDLMPLEDIPKLVRRLDGLFESYTDSYINHCKEKCLEGDLEVPNMWSASSEIVRYKSFTSSKTGGGASVGASDSRCYVENSKVSESLLLMKFYFLSSNVVNHLLSDRDGKELDLPFEVTDQELEIILFFKSTFILGRSGTGKTTVLTMKLFRNEQAHDMATQVFNNNDSNSSMDVFCGTHVERAKKNVLRQLFVTVSAKLCFAIRQHVSQLKGSVSGGKDLVEINSFDSDHIDNMEQFKDIPNSFTDIDPQSYPLVISFHKFLMMLDGTIGNSYFERFPDVSLNSQENSGNSRSVALKTFLITKEVSYERFYSFYWPHFNAQRTKKFDPSRVFTEIISHIKGGLRAGQACDNRLSREDYILLAESRVSTLSSKQRDIIYDIFQDYEKMKAEKCEFDLSDLVNDLHQRLKGGLYQADVMDFVYIDEVQDLTMRQIALFKYICKNVSEGFVFSGDTAQTIARGIDFRFEDIRSLFYNEFLLESKSERNDGEKGKGQISKIYHLSENFRTHAGVLNLAQSVIDLLYRFFPLSVDILGHETSRIYGEPPILLESGSEENAIISIFGNTHSTGEKMVGFGAEQVILVRDESAKREVSNCVGKQALVLTIVECKGLEFQDVLLYNFFGSSPLKNKWRVIYKYMEEQSLFDESSSKTSPNFSQTKHNVLCSELKQLYVAITRTRQRLWICENVEEFAKPMFDYWSRMCLVQFRKLDSSLAQAMQVASSPEEWKKRGYKLLRQGNYEMSTMCFERAGDTYGEKLAKALGLKASADHMHGTNPAMACIIRREAAEIFESIGKADNAAECFYLLKEYERAGRIYLEKCREPQIEKAGECFLLAECYELAAEVYARGNFLLKCLSVCSKGNLFDIGLRYIQYWKQHATVDGSVIRRDAYIDKIEQEFLEKCAVHYYNLKDNRSMLNFVKAFHSMDTKRNFLKMLGCLDELLLLEEDMGNFVEAANIAKLGGDLVREADLLRKAGRFKEASTLLLWYVLMNSLWAPCSSGWPLKHFANQEELLTKSKVFAKNVSDSFYEYVCTEADILACEQSSLPIMSKSLSSSRTHESLRGEILSARKVIDAHLHLSSSKYLWEDELVLDLEKHSKNMLSKSKVSVETLVYFWNIWMEKIVLILEYLRRFETEEVTEVTSYGEFCFNYFGVRNQFDNLHTIYILHNPDAEWVRDLDHRFLTKNGKLVLIDLQQFAATARSYWSNEILSFGITVLKNLEVLYNYSHNNALSAFCQLRGLACIYEVAKSLLENNLVDRRYFVTNTLRKFLKFSSDNFYSVVFSLNFRRSVTESMILLRGTLVCGKLSRECILEHVSLRNNLTYGQLGRVAVLILGSVDKINHELYKKIAGRFYGNSPWKVFIDVLHGNIVSESQQGPYKVGDAPTEMLLIQNFHGALKDAYAVNWVKEYDYISPDCFLYLVERFLILACQFQNGCFFTTNYSFIEWFVCNHTVASLPSGFDMQLLLGPCIEFIIKFVEELLYKRLDTQEWMRKSNINVKEFYPLLVFRLVAILCLLYANFGICLNLLSSLLGLNYITKELPLELCNALRLMRKRQFQNANVLAAAFKSIDDPLVFVSFRKGHSKHTCPEAIFVDMTVNKSMEDIVRLMFPKKNKAPQNQTGATDSCQPLVSSNDEVKNVELPPSKTDSTINQDLSCIKFWEALNPSKFLGNAPTFKVGVEKNILLLTKAVEDCQKDESYVECRNLLGEATAMLDEMKQLAKALAESELTPSNCSRIDELINNCNHVRRPKMMPFLNKLLYQDDKNPEGESSSPSETGTTSNVHCEDGNSKGGKNSNSGKSEVINAQDNTAKPSKSQEHVNKGKGKNKPKKGKGKAKGKGRK